MAGRKEDSARGRVEAPYFRPRKASTAWERSVRARLIGAAEVVVRRELDLQNEVAQWAGLCVREPAEVVVPSVLAAPRGLVFPPFDAATWSHALRLFRARTGDAR